MEMSSEPSLQFNVSHSGDVVLLGFALRNLGVDVERRQDGVDFAGLAKTSFSQMEQDTILALTPEKRASLFYEYWTCKEACIKADGRGLSAPLHQFSIVASARGSEWRDVAVANPGVFESAWRVRMLGTIPGYAAAVAAPGDGWDVVRMQLAEVNSSL
jgi:4'-phosphopantetheinyl transferase